MVLGDTLTHAPIPVGQELLQGRLVIRGVLGSGSMGVVYRADDHQLDRQVALKTLANFDGDRLYQLKREFRTLAGLSHPNLVQLYELGAADSLWFLIMELIDGVQLSQWLRNNPTQERMLRVFGELAEGLRVLHTIGLMHRDVKPSNVMITSSDRPILLDFGLAAPIRGSAATMTAGTLDYIAPEQLWNESPGPAADWFSFGVVLFEALTGRHPYAGPDMLRAMRRGLKEGPKAHSPNVSPALDVMVRRLLDPDPRQRPDPAELRDVLDSPVTSAVSAPFIRQTPFVGRADDLRLLHRALDEVELGATQVIHVHGQSGIGKTALVRQFLQEAQSSSRALVLEGSCHPQESVPYKALDALIDNLARHLLGLDGRAVLALAPRHAAALLYVFPVLGRVPAVREWPAPSTEQSPAELRRQGVDALRELIGKLADQQIVVLSIDDIQWSDRDSGVMLRALLTPPDAPRLLLLLTSRDDQAQAPLLEAFANVVTTVDLKLERLTTPESLTLARDLARGMSLSADTDSIAAEAGGSPFLLGELVRYFHERRSESAVLPPLTVADVVKWRFQHLSHDARRLLEVVAIAGRPLETSLALEVAGIGRAGRLLAYSLCSDCLLRITTQDEQGFLETYHDRFRQFAIAELAPEEKRHHHHVLADAIRAGRNPDARALVEHYLAADEHGEASRFALIAAHEAERDLAFDQAVDMYDVALKFRMGAATDPEVLERRAQMLANAARRTEAAHAYEATARVIANVNSEARTALRVQAAEQFFYGGELRQGLSVLEGVLGDIGIRLPAAPLARSIGGQWRRAKFIVRGSRVSARDPSTIKPDTRARLDALWRVTRGVVMLDPALADVLAGTHLLESLRCGDASRSLRAIGLEAAFEANIGGRWFRERSRFLLQEADLTAAQTGDPYDLAWLAHCRAACAWFDGRWLECVSLGGDAESRLKAAGAGTSWELAVLYGFVLSALANLGRLKDLSRKVSELVTDAERRQDQYALRVFQTGDAVMMWLAADRAKEALQVADQTLRDYPTNRFTSQHRHHFVAAVQSLLYAGEFEQAWAQVERSWVPLRWSGFLLLDCLGTQLRYLRACAALALARAPSCGRPAHLLRIARRETRRIRRSTLPMASPMADAIEAGIAGAERRRDTQIRALRAASNGFDRADMALHREAALWHLASLRSDLTEGGNDGAAWMEQHGIVRPASMARAVVPAA